ncbi:MAG: hypothetical protein HeimC3_34100 [Candidatus Heimdallarchaeota archaeon LC_3]|nr:MAG: hypothetical protein HeimC3_34100 [Candidatus Heimdallarchaeota archaeon LC_3]
MIRFQKKVLEEQLFLTSQLDKWKALYESNTSIYDRMKQTQIIDYIKQAQRLTNLTILPLKSGYQTLLLLINNLRILIPNKPPKYNNNMNIPIKIAPPIKIIKNKIIIIMMAIPSAPAIILLET